MRKTPALLGGALLLVGGTCFAQDPWPDQYSATTGPDAQKEFAALPENGRAAYKRGFDCVFVVRRSLLRSQIQKPMRNCVQKF
jgi:hypothetical protein